MGMTSAAEAKLEARIRPDITLLRSRTPYPKRHRPPLAVLPGGTEPGPAAAGQAGQAGQAGKHADAGAPASESAGHRIPPSGPAAGTLARAARPAAAPGPIRLTRRGRIVVGALVAIAVAGVAALIWLAVAGRADAANHVRPGGSAAGTMVRVVVRPGQTLWSIAATADPTADPRIVIQQIVDDNALGGTGIRAGQVLWVPRS
ncbi:MAG TPA: LysM peptidoglycan-binding domain-containing protein [Streptosporangiaceae bacterium]|nr:LysM peptidoglycan-binding domain-containing protein [Streptosporangiaceae bacterium]